MKYKLTKKINNLGKADNDYKIYDTIVETEDFPVMVGKWKCCIWSYVKKNYMGTYDGLYQISANFGWGGSIGIKNIRVTEQASAELAYTKVVAKAERWMAKNLETSRA